MSDRRHGLRNWASSKFARVVHWRQRHGRSRSTESESLESLNTTVHVNSMAHSVETLSRVISRKLAEFEKNQQAHDELLRNLRERERIILEIRGALVTLEKRVLASERELKAMQSVLVCSNLQNAQLAMVIFAKGILSRNGVASRSSHKDATTSGSQSRLDETIISQSRTSSPSRIELKMDMKLFILMIASLLSLLLEICRARMRTLPTSVVRALRCVEEVCKASCLLALGALWELLRDVALKILERFVGWIRSTMTSTTTSTS